MRCLSCRYISIVQSTGQVYIDVFKQGIWSSILNEWCSRPGVPGHVVTNKTSALPLCQSCGLIPDIHLPNYYETEWINLLDVESVCMYVVIITLLVLPGSLGWYFLNLHHGSSGTGNSDTQMQLWPMMTSMWRYVRTPTKWSKTHSPWPILHPYNLLII